MSRIWICLQGGELVISETEVLVRIMTAGIKRRDLGNNAGT
jgi:hypothetical protein